MTAPTCPDCGAELVALRTVARLVWRPTDVAWEGEGERVRWVHRVGITCTPAADRQRDDDAGRRDGE